MLAPAMAPSAEQPSDDGAKELARRALAGVTLTNGLASRTLPAQAQAFPEEAAPISERGRNARVIDEVAHESFDALTSKTETAASSARKTLCAESPPIEVRTAPHWR
jgi:hypothetical protein